MRCRPVKRLGCLAIGDEILAGHVHESNSHWLAKRLKAMGIELARVEICTDGLADVQASVRRFLFDLDLDYVVTSGGLGPTPDDRTMQGLADALGVPLVLTPENEAWMQQRVAYGHKVGYFNTKEPNEGMLKMAYLPEGAVAMPNHVGTCLGAIVYGDATLFTLPGVPQEFMRMFDESVAPLLEGSRPLHVEELVLYTEESRLYTLLRRLDEAYVDVTLGSYPQRGQILIRATGPADRARQLIAEVRTEAADYLSP